MAQRRRLKSLYAALADLGNRVPVVRLERVDQLCPSLHKSNISSWKVKEVKEKRAKTNINKESDNCQKTSKQRGRKRGKKRGRKTSRSAFSAYQDSCSDFEEEEVIREQVVETRGNCKYSPVLEEQSERAQKSEKYLESSSKQSRREEESSELCISSQESPSEGTKDIRGTIQNTSTVEEVTVKHSAVNNFEETANKNNRIEDTTVQNIINITIKQDTLHDIEEITVQSELKGKEMFPEICNKDPSTTSEPPKKQHKMQQKLSPSSNSSNERISPKSISPSQSIRTEVIAVEKIRGNSPSLQDPSSDPLATPPANTKTFSPNCWDSNKPVLNSSSFSSENVSAIQVPTYSENVMPKMEAQNSFSGSVRPSTYSGHNGPGVSANVYRHSNGTRPNNPYSDVNGPAMNAYTGNSCVNSPLYSGINGPGTVNYPVNTSALSTAYSGTNAQGVQTQSFPGYSNMPVCSVNNVSNMNSQTYTSSSRTGLNHNYDGSITQGMNTPQYSSTPRPMILPVVYYGNSISVINPQAYPVNSSAGINTPVYPVSSNQPYSGNTDCERNNLVYFLNAGQMTPQMYPGNNGMNAVVYSNSAAENKVNYTGNKAPEQTVLPYPVNSAYPGNGSTTFSGDYSANRAVTTSMTYSGNSTVTSQASSSFPGNLIAQQYEVLQNYCENAAAGVNTTSCQNSTWSNDYITLNNLHSSGYQSSGNSLDFTCVYLCQMCGTVFPTSNDLIKHWRIHNGVESLTCTACYVSFTDVLFLQAHWKAIHMGGVCTDQGVVVTNDQKVTSELICEVCGFLFSHFQALEQHLMSTHVNSAQQRANMSWKSPMCNIDNTQQNHVINNKGIPNLPLGSQHSVRKHSTVLDNNLTGTGTRNHPVLEHQNVSLENIVGNKIETLSQSDNDLLDSKTKLDEFDGNSSSDESVSSNDSKPFKCRVCDIGSSSLEELLEHWKIHIGADTSTCSTCKKTFSDLPFLQAHWRRSHMNTFQLSNLASRTSVQSEGSPFVCDGCGCGFSDFPELEQHMLSNHVFPGEQPQIPLRSRNSVDNIQKFSLTPLLNISTARTLSHKVDSLSHYKTKETSCDLVKKMVSDKPENKKLDEETERKKEEIRRRLNASSIVKKTVSSDGCLVCGEIPSDMIKHLIVHTGLSTLECCLCGKDFVDVPFLQAHWRATHMNGEVRHTNHGIYVGNYKENISYTGKFLCETCGCYVPQFSALEKHIVLTHTIIEPPYVCKCGHMFPSEDELKRHISTCSW